MKILITGASGFIGKSLVKKLKENHHILALDNKRFNEPFFKQVDTFRLDLANLRSKNYDIEEIDSIIHLASSVNHPGSLEMFNYNLAITRNLLERFSSESLKSFYYFSSLSVLNLPAIRKYNVNTLKAKTFYQKSKLACEKLCESYSDRYNFRLSIIRPPMVYDFSDPQKEVYSLLNLVDFGLVPVIGSGRNLINVMHRSELVNTVKNLIRRGDEGCCNLTGDTITLNRFLQKIADSRNQDYLPVNVPLTIVSQIAPLVEKLSKFLNIKIYLSKSRLETIRNSIK